VFTPVHFVALATATEEHEQHHARNDQLSICFDAEHVRGLCDADTQVFQPLGRTVASIGLESTAASRVASTFKYAPRETRCR
jgi:hypothetical protein